MSGTLNMETASVVSANSGHGRIESLQRETDKLRRDLQRSRQESERLELELAQSQQEAGLVRRQLSREQQARADYDAQLRALGNAGGSGDAAAYARAANSRASLAEGQTRFLQDEISRLESELKEAKVTSFEARLRQESAEQEVLGYQKEVQALIVERDALLDLIRSLRLQLQDSKDDADPHQLAELRRELADRDAEIRGLRAQLREGGGNITDEEYRRCLEELTLLRDESIRSREQFLSAQQELADRARNAKELQDSLNDELQDVRYQLADMTAAYERALQEINSLREQLRRLQAQSTYSAAPSPSAVSSPRRMHVSGVTGWGEGQFTIPNRGPKGAYFFPVYVDSSPAALNNNLIGPAWLRVTHTDLALLDQRSWDELASFELDHVRRFGRDEGCLSFEVGRKCLLGEGVYYLGTAHMMDIFDVISRATGSA